MKPGTNLAALTGLRFFAASWVVYYHAQSLRDEAPWALDRLGAIGFTAVPLFFVLSGFVLTWNHADAFDEGRASVGRFLLARAARVMPLFLLALGWTSTYVWPYLPAPRPLLSIALGLNAWQPSWAWLANVASWSISVELFFYALFPVLIVLVPGGKSWLGTPRGLLVLMGSAYALGFVPWMAARAEGIHDSFFLDFWPPFHLPEFVVGMALGRLALHEARRDEAPRRDGTVLVLGALAGYALVAWVLFLDLPHALLSNGLLVPLHGALVVGLARGGSAARPLAHPWIVRAGELGYAIYILQEPVLTTLRLRVWDFHAEHGVLLLGGNLVYYATLLAVAALVHRFVEKPARARLRSLAPRSARVLGIAAGLVLTFAIGWSLVERVSDDWGPEVVVTGDFTEELGCRRDWDFACARTRLRRVPTAEPSELLYEGSFPMPAGSWTAQVALDEAMSRDRPPATAPITLERETEVRWRYSDRTGRLVRVTDPIVTVVGSFQHLAGCTSDWMPDCLATELVALDGAPRRELTLPAGHYEAKVAVGRSWSENYGRDGVQGGENVVFDVREGQGRVVFTYDPTTHRLDVDAR